MTSNGIVLFCEKCKRLDYKPCTLATVQSIVNQFRQHSDVVDDKIRCLYKGEYEERNGVISSNTDFYGMSEKSK